MDPRASVVQLTVFLAACATTAVARAEFLTLRGGGGEAGREEGNGTMSKVWL